MGLIPSAGGEPPAVWRWETSDRRLTEPWGDYCERTADESIAVVTDMKVEDEARPDIRDDLFFNVTYVGQGEV